MQAAMVGAAGAASISLYCNPNHHHHYHLFFYSDRSTLPPQSSIPLCPPIRITTNEFALLSSSNSIISTSTAAPLLPVSASCSPSGGRPSISGIKNTSQEQRQAARVERLWQQFFLDPSQWWDERFDKANPKASDFKHKTSKKELWINDRFSPLWLQAKLATLTQQPPQESSSSSSSSSSICGIVSSQASRTRQLWEEFFSDPSQWWDYRNDKRNPRFPDFTHKIAKKALWIDNKFNPPWVHAKLVAMVQCQEEGQSGFSTPAISGRAVRMEQLWQEFFSDPSQWWDNRFKRSPKYPDFEHKSTHEGLWIEGWLNPPWVKAKIQSGGGFRSWVPDSFGNVDNVSKLCVEGRLKEALHMVQVLVHQNIQVPIDIYVGLLKLCTKRKELAEGKQVHALIVQSGLDSDIFIGNTLVDMYAKCGSVLDAREVFNIMPEYNVFSWTAIISAYADHGQGEEAINLFQQMQQTGIAPDKVAFVVVLNACASIAALDLGKELHFKIMRSGFQSDVIVGNALVDMYAKCGSIEHARQVFNNMRERTVVSWSAMLAGYAQQGLGKEALALYEQMKVEGVEPNNVTYAILLNACANIAALEEGKQLHSSILKSSMEVDVIVGNTLVDMYAKCGCIEDAYEVFIKMKEKNVVSWNTMIAGYSQQGLGKEALTLWEKMLREGMKPNEVTYVNILSACSHSGLLDEGRHVFDSMCKDGGVTLTVDHYACMVDLLGRAGCLADAEDFINKMPIQPNAVVWRSLLGAARNHGHVEIGRRAFDCIVKLEPANASAYVLLSNIYAAVGRMDEVAKIGKEKDVGMKKMSGCS